MASYAVAHLKLSFKLAQTGYTLRDGDRINIFLTNTLELEPFPRIHGSPALRGARTGSSGSQCREAQQAFHCGAWEPTLLRALFKHDRVRAAACGCVQDC